MKISDGKMFQGEEKEIAKDANEKHTWCAERTEAKWGLNRVSWEKSGKT